MGEDGYVIRLRGLPWSATQAEVEKFLGDDVQIVGGPEAGIKFTFTSEGKPSGEAFVELESEEDLDNALKKDNENIGSRYIEVFKSKRSEMEWVTERTGAGALKEGRCVRLRGLPFECLKSDIEEFFKGLDIVRDGITLPLDGQGRASGEAYVQFTTEEHAQQALEKDRQTIGHRYIEIFPCNPDDIRSVVGPRRGGNNRPGPYNRSRDYGGRPMGRFKGSFGGFGGGGGSDGFGGPRGGYGGYGGFGGGGGYGRGGGRGGMQRFWGGGSGMSSNYGGYGGYGGGGGGGSGSGGGGGGFGMDHCVHLRGLPYSATEKDVRQFFEGVANPKRIILDYDGSNRMTGEADVEFYSHGDAQKAAMAKHNQHMGTRYIECFLQSNQGQTGFGGGNFNGNNYGDDFGDYGNFGGYSGGGYGDGY